MTDSWANNWANEAAVRSVEEERTNERRREAIAELLAARGHVQAAALVIISRFQSVHVDDWGGGQYEGYLSVPAAQYDLVSDEMRDRIDGATRAVIGTDHYQGLNVDVQLGDALDGWAQQLLQRLRDQQEECHPSPLALPASTNEQA